MRAARSAPLFASLLLLLAGCATPTFGGGEGGGAEDGGVGGEARFLPAYDLGQGGPEPVVAFSPDGSRLYVAAQDPLGGGPRVWISSDGGEAWVEKRPTTQGGGELDLAAGPDGLVVVTQLGTTGNIVSVSRDHGETWSTSPLGGFTQYFDREWTAIDAQGRVYLVAREFSVAGSTSAGISRSDDRGASFQPYGKAWTALDEPGEANGPLLATGSELHLVFICRGGEAVCIASSRDAGVTWTQTLIADRGGNVANVYPAIASGAGGLLVVWSDATQGALAVHLAHSGDGGRTWSAPTQVSPEGGTATLPWIAARGSTAWVVYLHADGSLSATDCADAGAVGWTPHARPLSSRGEPAGDAVALTAEPVHTGVISPPVGQTCSGGGRDRNFGDFFTATLSPAGKLVVAVSADEGTPESTRDLVIRER